MMACTWWVTGSELSVPSQKEWSRKKGRIWKFDKHGYTLVNYFMMREYILGLLLLKK